MRSPGPAVAPGSPAAARRSGPAAGVPARGARCGSTGTGPGLAVPGPIRHSVMRHLMTETWHNYFLNPQQAPDPDQRWLAGCSASAMIKTSSV